MQHVQSLGGFCVLLLLAWLFSENRRNIHLRFLLSGVALQFLLAALLLKVPFLQAGLESLNSAVLALQEATDAGTSFVFGYLGAGPQPFEETQPGASFILAFRALPLVIVVSALTAILTWWRILPWVVRLFSLVHLVNTILGLLPDVAGSAITLERVLGLVMAPVVWLMGIPWSEAGTAGSLMGVKTILNEFLAYLQLSQLPPDALDERSRLIMTYALCGFANFGSLGIMIAGLTTMAPQRKQEILQLGLKSMVAGTLATCCTGAVVGVLI